LRRPGPDLMTSARRLRRPPHVRHDAPGTLPARRSPMSGTTPDAPTPACPARRPGTRHDAPARRPTDARMSGTTPPARLMSGTPPPYVRHRDPAATPPTPPRHAPHATGTRLRAPRRALRAPGTRYRLRLPGRGRLSSSRRRPPVRQTHAQSGPGPLGGRPGDRRDVDAIEAPASLPSPSWPDVEAPRADRRPREGEPAAASEA
jgi:hypothetical protein